MASTNFTFSCQGFSEVHGLSCVEGVLLPPNQKYSSSLSSATHLLALEICLSTKTVVILSSVCDYIRFPHPRSMQGSARPWICTQCQLPACRTNFSAEDLRTGQCLVFHNQKHELATARTRAHSPQECLEFLLRRYPFVLTTRILSSMDCSRS